MGDSAFSTSNHAFCTEKFKRKLIVYLTSNWERLQTVTESPWDIFPGIESICKEALENQDWYTALLDQVNEVTSYTCAHQFNHGELIYQCRDCSIDETCVLCDRCFDPTQHLNHKYRYYVSKSSGGTCDCGEIESFRVSLSCKFHSAPSQSIYITSPSDHSSIVENHLELDFPAKKSLDNIHKPSPSIEKKSLQFFISMAKVICQLTSETHESNSTPQIKEEECLRGVWASFILNDDHHTFDQVINAVQNAFGCSKKRAKQIADDVDSKGYGLLSLHTLFEALNSNDPLLKEKTAQISAAFDKISMKLYIQSAHSILRRLLVDSLLEWIICIAERWPQLRATIALALSIPSIDLQEIFNKSIYLDWKNEDSEYECLLSHMNTVFHSEGKFPPLLLSFCGERLLWKNFSLSMQRLVTFGLAIPQVKEKLLLCYEFSLKFLIFNSLSNFDPNHQLNINPVWDEKSSWLSYSVQVFTVPSVALEAVRRNMHITTLKELTKLICKCTVGADRNDRLSEILKCIQVVQKTIDIVRFITRDPVGNTTIFNGTSHFFIREFFNFLMQLNEIRILNREKHEHILFEDSSWTAEVMINSFVLELVIEIFSSVPKNLEKFAENTTGSLDINQISALINDDWRDKIAFSQTLVYFFANLCENWFLTQNALSFQTKTPKSLPLPDHDKFTLNISKYCMRFIRTFSDVLDGAWVRNGIVVQSQARLMNSGMAYGYFYMFLSILFNSIIHLSSKEELRESFVAEILLDFNLIKLDDNSSSIHSEYSSANFKFEHYNENTNPNLQIVIIKSAANLIQWFLCTIIGSTISLCEDINDAIQFIVVHALALGPASHSELIKRLPVAYRHFDGLESIISQVALFREPESPLAHGNFHLKSTSSSLYTPYFWLYNDHERKESLEYMTKKHSFKFSQLLSSESNRFCNINKRPLKFVTGFLRSKLLSLFLSEIVKLIVKKPAGDLNTPVLRDALVFLDLVVKSSSVDIHEIIAFNLFSNSFSLSTLLSESDDITRKMIRSVFGGLLESLDSAVVDTESIRQIKLDLKFGQQDRFFEIQNSEELKNRRIDSEERRLRILENMRATQQKFLVENSDATTFQEVSTNFDDVLEDTGQEHLEMVETGICIICHNPAGHGTDSYGVLSLPHLYGKPADIQLSTNTQRGPVAEMLLDYEKRGNYLTKYAFTSCMHIMHDPCYTRYLSTTAPIRANNGHGTTLYRLCPLCNAPFVCLLPVKPSIITGIDSQEKLDALIKIACEPFQRIKFEALNTCILDSEENQTENVLAKGNTLNSSLKIRKRSFAHRSLPNEGNPRSRNMDFSSNQLQPFLEMEIIDDSDESIYVGTLETSDHSEDYHSVQSNENDSESGLESSTENKNHIRFDDCFNIITSDDSIFSNHTTEESYDHSSEYYSESKGGYSTDENLILNQTTDHNNLTETREINCTDQVLNYTLTSPPTLENTQIDADEDIDQDSDWTNEETATEGEITENHLQNLNFPAIENWISSVERGELIDGEEISDTIYYEEDEFGSEDDFEDQVGMIEEDEGTEDVENMLRRMLEPMMDNFDEDAADTMFESIEPQDLYNRGTGIRSLTFASQNGEITGDSSLKMSDIDLAIRNECSILSSQIMYGDGVFNDCFYAWALHAYTYQAEALYNLSGSATFDELTSLSRIANVMRAYVAHVSREQLSKGNHAIKDLEDMINGDKKIEEKDCLDLYIRLMLLIKIDARNQIDCQKEPKKDQIESSAYSNNHIVHWILGIDDCAKHIFTFLMSDIVKFSFKNTGENMAMQEIIQKILENPQLYPDLIKKISAHGVFFSRLVYLFRSFWITGKFPLLESIEELDRCCLSLILGEHNVPKTMTETSIGRLIIENISVWFERNVNMITLPNYTGSMREFPLTGSLHESPYQSRKTRLQERIRFVKLPSEYSAFFRDPWNKKPCINHCPPQQEIAICIRCGKTLCVGGKSNKCGGCVSSGPCRTHMYHCGRSQGIFLLPRFNGMLLMTPLRAKMVPAPYLDKHGESDFGFRRGGPFYFSEARHRHLCNMWITMGVHTFIEQNSEPSSSSLSPINI